MFYRKSKYLIAFGSFVLLSLMIIAIVSGLNHMGAINKRMNLVLEQHYSKIGALGIMRDVAHQRSLSMYAIYFLDDEFQRDEEFMYFSELGRRFIHARETFEKFPIADEQKILYENILKNIRQSAPLQQSIVDAIMDGKKQGQTRKIVEQDYPLEQSILRAIDALVLVERGEFEKSVADANSKYEQAYSSMNYFGGSIVTFGLVVAIFVVWRSSKNERDLFWQKERAQITLNSIGDGVITTDEKNRIVSMNPAAEYLTGWTIQEAYLKAIPEVYQLLDRMDKTKIEHPILDSADDGISSGVFKYALLNNRRHEQLLVKDYFSPIKTPTGEILGKVIVVRDITQEQQLTQQILWNASHDALTGLSNRREFDNQLNKLLTLSATENNEHILLYLDLDQFKIVNDSCGHVAGDELLTQVAKILRECIRDADIVARLGGDEFGIILVNCSLDVGEKIAKKLVEQISNFRFFWKKQSFVIGTSIGIVSISKKSSSVADILSAADAACYLAKDEGRNRYVIHQSNNVEVSRRRSEMQWVGRINEAIEQDRFILYRQNGKGISGKAKGSMYTELLIRMKDVNGEVISPMAFIPAAERYGVMSKIDRWVIRNAFDWVVSLPKSREEFICAINISAQSLSDDGLLPYITSEVQRSKIDPSHICFEITETATISNWSKASSFIESLRKIGFRFALDDFGSGMSSFAYLKNMAVDFVKIDGNFVRDILADEIDRVMVESINHLGHAMGIRTIAESVEDDATLALLTKMEIDFGQGFGIHRPSPL